MQRLCYKLTCTKVEIQYSRIFPTITIYDNQVSQVTTAKSLGVTIDNTLDWSSHIDKLTKKVASGIGAIKRIRHLVAQATLLLLYQALIAATF